MTQPNAKIPSRLCARYAGVLYLIIIVCGIFSEVVVRSRFIVPNDAGATAGNILAAQPFFRLGFLADSVMIVADVAVAILLYVLFKTIHKTLSLAAAAFRLTQAAILGLNLLNYHAATLLVGGTVYAAGFQSVPANSLALLFLDLHGHGYDLGLIFFGVANIILGVLVVRSTGIPSLLGYGLIGAAVVYLLGSYTRFLFPAGLPYISPLYVIPLVAELSFCLWLLIKGMPEPGKASPV